MASVLGVVVHVGWHFGFDVIGIDVLSRVPGQGVSSTCGTGHDWSEAVSDSKSRKGQRSWRA